MTRLGNSNVPLSFWRKQTSAYLEWVSTQEDILKNMFVIIPILDVSGFKYVNGPWSLVNHRKSFKFILLVYLFISFMVCQCENSTDKSVGCWATSSHLIGWHFVPSQLSLIHCLFDFYEGSLGQTVGCCYFRNDALFMLYVGHMYLYSH